MKQELGQELKHVAHHLRDRALHLRDQALNSSAHSAHCDAFARSAYNRYYYACFLCVRDTLTKMNIGTPAERKMHAKISRLLDKQVTTRFTKQLKESRENEEDYIVVIMNSAIEATSRLKDVMLDAKATRTTADYEIDSLVDFNENGIFLLKGVKTRNSCKDVSIGRMYNWHEDVIILANNILTAYDSVDKKFKTNDKKTKTIDKKTKTIDKKFKTIDKRFKNIDKRFKRSK